MDKSERVAFNASFKHFSDFFLRHLKAARSVWAISHGAK